jgi:hypothetical protein
MKKTLLIITILTLALGTFSVAAAGDCARAGKTAGAVCGTSAAVQVSAATALGACCPVTATAAYEQAEWQAEAELANLEKASKPDAS